MAQPNNCKLSLQALERRVQEVQELLRNQEEVAAACKNQSKSLAAEKLAADKAYVAEYNGLATE